MADLNRRALLKRLGVTAGVAALAGCDFFSSDGPSTPRPGGTPRRPAAYRDRFETVVDLGEAGADRNGEESAVDVLRDALDDDTLVFLPRGEYLLDDTVQFLDFENSGIVGNDATIRPADRFDSVLFDIGRSDMGSDFLLEGVEFDIRAERTGPRPVSLLAGGNSAVRDVTVIGTQDAGWGGIRIDTTDPDGVTTVDRLYLPDGSTPDVGTAGCYVGDHHVGEIRFNDCHINGFSDNGLYADTPRGAVRVNGGYFANCDVSSLRVGSDSQVRGAHVRCDRAPDGFENMRGLRLRAGGDVLVENTTIEMRAATYSDGGLVLAHWLESATIRNTHIQITTDDFPAVRIRDPNGEMSGDNSIRLENVTIDGPAGGGTTVEVDERPDCTFSNLWVFQSGENRDGFLFDSSRATVENSYINVTGRAMRSVEGSSVQRVNVRVPSGTASGEPTRPEVRTGTPVGPSAGTR